MSDETTLSMIPLAAAAIIVHKETTGRIATDPQALDPVAALIARHAPIYARERSGNGIAPLRRQVIEAAVFLDCGKLMRSSDVSYTELCIRRGDLPAVIEKLTQSRVRRN